MDKARAEQETKGGGPKNKRKISALESRVEELQSTVASLRQRQPPNDDADLEQARTGGSGGLGGATTNNEEIIDGEIMNEASRRKERHCQSQVSFSWCTRRTTLDDIKKVQGQHG